MSACVQYVVECLKFVIYRLTPLAVALFVGFLLYNALDRRIPVTIMGGEVTPKIVTAGSDAVIAWDMKWSRSDCIGVVEPELITDENIVWKYATIHVYGPSNLDGIVRPFFVPRLLHPGKVRYRGRVFFTCNWFQRFFPLEINIPDVAFEVVAPPARPDAQPR